MTLMEIIIKILLFFSIFYGAIALTTFFAKKIREKEKKAPKK